MKPLKAMEEEMISKSKKESILGLKSMKWKQPKANTKYQWNEEFVLRENKIEKPLIKSMVSHLFSFSVWKKNNTALHLHSILELKKERKHWVF